MTIYIAEIVLLSVLGAIFNNQGQIVRNKKRFAVLAFLVLTLVSGLRGFTVGADTRTYVNLFQNISAISIVNTRYEAGFILYLKGIALISKNPGVMLFISSAICIGSACWFMYRHSDNMLLSILLYIFLGGYFSQMNIMRQAIALSVLLVSSDMILREQWVKSLILIFVAISLHSVAVIWFVIWALGFWLSKQTRPISRQYCIFVVLLVAVISFVMYSAIMWIVGRIFPSYIGYFQGTWSDSNYSASLMQSFIALVFLVVGIVWYKDKNFSWQQAMKLLLVGFSLIFQVLSMRMEIWNRVAGFFSIYIYALWVPEFLNQIKLRSNKVIVLGGILVGAFSYMLVVLILRPEWTSVVPYVFR